MLRATSVVLAAAAVCGSVVLWRYFKRQESEDSYEDLTGGVAVDAGIVTPSVPARIVRQKPAVSKPCIPRAAAVLTAKRGSACRPGFVFVANGGR